MPDDRTNFIVYQRRYLAEVSALTDGEDEMWAVFETLAVDTHDALVAAGSNVWVHGYSICPDSAWNWLMTTWEHGLVAPDLVERWRQWAAGYPALLTRNPKLELRDLMQDISESHDSSSFPYRYEDAIFEWVLAGDISEPPFDDRHGIVDDAFYSAMRRLQGDLMGGWLWWDEAAAAQVYVARDQWDVVRAERKAERAEYRRQREERAANDPKFAAMLADVRRRREGKTG